MLRASLLGFIVSDIKYLVNILDGLAFTTLNMNIENTSNKAAEFEYQIPIIFCHNIISFSISFKNQEKIVIIDSERNKMNQILFDDEVASNNFSISLKQKDSNTTILILANFPRNSKVGLSIQAQSTLFDNLKNFYFQIPLIENQNFYLYPNYSVELTFWPNSEKECKDIQIEYNKENNSDNFYCKTKIQINDISFNHPFIYKITPQRSKLNLLSLKKQTDIILFIDSMLVSDQFLQSLILNFFLNFGKNFKFNIIKYGANSDILSLKMIEKNNESFNKIRHFLNSKKMNGLQLTFTQFYSEIFGSDSILNCSEKVEIEKRFKIDNMNFSSTIAICIGSVSSNQIITSKKVTTYLIDPIQIFNSNLFCARNDFIFIGPIINSEDELEYSFESLSQLLLIKYQETTTERQIENEKFYQKLNEFCDEKNFENFKKFVLKNHLNFNMNFEKLEYLKEKIKMNNMIGIQDINQFLINIGFEVETDYLNDMLRENEQISKMIKNLIIIKAFGGRLFINFYENPFKKNLIKIINSIEKNQFVSFKEEENEVDNTDKYVSSHCSKIKNIGEDEIKNYKPNYQKMPAVITKKNKYFYHDSQYIDRNIKQMKSQNDNIINNTNQLKSNFIISKIECGFQKDEEYGQIANHLSNSLNIDLSPQISLIPEDSDFDFILAP